MFLTAMITVLSLALGSAPAHLAPQSTTAGPMALSGSGHHGPAAGQFSVPGPSGPGQMLGVMRAPNGTVLFHIQAHVNASTTSPAEGTLDGVIVRVAGPNPGPFALLHGVWKHDPVHGDRFHGMILRPPSPAHPTPTPIGTIKGQWYDPDGPQPQVGHFLGAWRIP